jgi:hypothetical protein
MDGNRLRLIYEIRVEQCQRGNILLITALWFVHCSRSNQPSPSKIVRVLTLWYRRSVSYRF